MDLIRSFLGWFGGALLKDTWYIRSIALFLTALGSLIMTIASLVWAFVDLPAALQTVTAQINALNATLQALPVNGTMSAVNRVLPLNEFLIMEGLLIGISILSLMVRGIKSFLFGIN